jgi:hypothetical protein
VFHVAIGHGQDLVSGHQPAGQGNNVPPTAIDKVAALLCPAWAPGSWRLGTPAGTPGRRPDTSTPPRDVKRQHHPSTDRSPAGQPSSHRRWNASHAKKAPLVSRPWALSLSRRGSANRRRRRPPGTGNMATSGRSMPNVILTPAHICICYYVFLS